MSSYMVLSHTGVHAMFATHDVATPPSLSKMQEIVGGYIAPAFTIPSPMGKGREITGYVNDEGLCIGLPQFIIMTGIGGYQGLAGNMLILGLSKTGKTVTLHPDEVSFMMKRIRIITLADGTQTFVVLLPQEDEY